MMRYSQVWGVAGGAALLLMLHAPVSLVSIPQAEEVAISGTITLDRLSNDRVPPAPLLVIIASKSPDPKKPPIIVKRIPDASFPYIYNLTEEDITLVGSTFEGSLYITARLETGAASGDIFEGTIRNSVDVGSNAADITITSRSKTISTRSVAPPAEPNAATVLRIGLLWSGSTPFDPWSVPAGLRQAFRELGYVDGQDIVFEGRYAEGDYDRLPRLAAELVALKVDLILAAGDSAAIQAAKNTAQTTPVVMIALADTVELGLVSSLASPGGNITGLSFPLSAIVGKQLELLKRTMPRVSRVGVLWNPANLSHAAVLKAIEAAARVLNVELERAEIRGQNDFEAAFAIMQKGGAEAAVVLWDPMLYAQGGSLALLALQHRLPTISTYREFAEAAGLMAYGPRLSDIFRGGASYADKIMRGTKPADLPVEQPTRFEFIINLTTAKALGVLIPQSMLVRADKLIR